MSNHPSIGIVGGGPGGLTLARLLHTHGLDCEVLEQEPHAQSRSQGGSLDLHEEGGVRALQLAGLEKEFEAAARPEDQTTTICDPTGRRLYRSHETGGLRPEIDRTALRQLLLASLPAKTVRWSFKVGAIEPRDDGRHDVVSSTGVRSTYDIVVGADGAWSRVRPLLTEATPIYQGVTLAELNIEGADERFPDLADTVGRGTLFAFGKGKGILAQRNGGGRIRIYAILEAALGELSEALAPLSPAEQKAHLLTRYEGWSSDLTALIAASQDEVVARPIYVLPVGLRWPTKRGLTLIGDAAHLMSPFAGEGVNMAMADAADLSVALANGLDPAAALAIYEDAMFERSTAAAQQSAHGLKLAVAQDGARQLAEMFSQFEP